MASSSPVVDIHTHVYPPSYISLLKSRTSVPYIREVPGSDVGRLIILPGEDDPNKEPGARGRAVGPDFWDIERKIQFMDAHNIAISVISLANPWLDFLPPDEAAATATNINNDLNALCDRYPSRLFAFGTLPLSAPRDAVVAEINRLHELKHMRGVIMGTSGIGQGLDDPELDMIYKALEDTSTLVFIHPHYGLPGEVYGPRSAEYGHVLPLALGFPLETTIAVTRMYLSGVWERFWNLQVLLAHSGGTLPFLAGRIDSCLLHDAALVAKAKAHQRRSIWDVLRDNVYLDAVIYSDVGLIAALNASGGDRLMFGMGGHAETWSRFVTFANQFSLGTDHPFFPPTDKSEQPRWLSVEMNSSSIEQLGEANMLVATEVMGANAVRVLRL